MKKNPTYFIFSIDTEEDQTYGYSEKASVKNIACLSDLFHGLCQKYHIKPTYLVDTPVVEIPSSQKIMQELAQEKDCKIGMHLHPWRTKPHLPNYQFPKHTHMTNYPSDIIGEKINKLFHEIQNISQQPCRTFRAGRWSMSTAAMEHLYPLGVNIDSSVTPYSNWEVYGGNNYSESVLQSYKFLSPHFLTPDPNGNAYEIPPSVGWTLGDLDTMHSIEKKLQRIPRLFKVKGALYYLHIMRKVWVSPEQTSTKDMINLCDNLIRQKQSYIHAILHSSSLLEGASEFSYNKKALNSLYRRIEELFQYVQTAQLIPVTLAKFVDEYQGPYL